MQNLSRIFVAVFTLFFIISCTPKQSTTAIRMDDTVWVLQSMTDKVPAGVEIELQFEKDKITGKGVCNRYFADYELNGKQIN